MNTINFGNKRLLGEFVYCYVEKAFELAEQGLPSEDFDNKLFDSVAKNCKLSKEAVLGLHHPFYWAFFNSGNGSSPFQIVSSGKLDNICYIKLIKDNYKEIEKEEAILSMSNKIIDNYGNIIVSKMEKIGNFLPLQNRKF